jgi:hypothetical protein
MSRNIYKQAFSIGFMKKGALVLGLFLISIMTLSLVNAGCFDVQDCGSCSGGCSNTYDTCAKMICTHVGTPCDSTSGFCYDGWDAEQRCYGSCGDGDGGTPAPTPTCSACGSYPNCYSKTEAKSWGTWGDYNSCSGDMNAATQSKSRTCNSQGNSCGGSNQCTGSSSESRACSVVQSGDWMNLRGTLITSSNSGDTVYMKVGGIGISGQSINYTVFSKEGASWRNLWGLLGIGFASGIPTSNPVYTLTNNTDHYYNAKTSNNNGVTEANSSTLQVSSASDSNPAVKLDFPQNEFLTSINYQTPFNQSSYDEDDLLQIIWNFGNNHNQTINDYSLAFTPSSGNIFYNYPIAGVYTVTLTAKEMSRSKSNSTSIIIYVLQPGLNIISKISSPIKGVAYGNWVTFNASSSYVVNCSSSIANYNFTAGNLQCKYVHVPFQRTITGNYDLRLNWSVYDSAGRMESGFPRAGSWKNNYSYIVEYPVYFDEARTRRAVLDITYSS